MLHLVLGPMFSGKTTALLDTAEQHKQNRVPYMCINHSLDSRYDRKGSLHTHDGRSDKNTLSVDKLTMVLGMPEYKNAKVVFVDESQFFDDLRDFILQAVDVDGKEVTIAGLDGDVHRELFPTIQSVIPLADTVVKLKSKCDVCGLPAIFTIRKNGCQSKRVIVGGSETYKAVCRKHFC